MIIRLQGIGVTRRGGDGTVVQGAAMIGVALVVDETPAGATGGPCGVVREVLVLDLERSRLEWLKVDDSLAFGLLQVVQQGGGIALPAPHSRPPPTR